MNILISKVLEKLEENEIECSNSSANLVNPENYDNLILDDEEKIETDEYGLNTIPVYTKKTYTQAHRRAQQKYRNKFPEKFQEMQKAIYDRKSKDEEWKKKFNERSRANNKIYREKKKEEMLKNGVEIKPRGRPRKVKPELVPEIKIQNIINPI